MPKVESRIFVTDDELLLRVSLPGGDEIAEVLETRGEDYAAIVSRIAEAANVAAFRQLRAELKKLDEDVASQRAVGGVSEPVAMVGALSEVADEPAVEVEERNEVVDWRPVGAVSPDLVSVTAFFAALVAVAAVAGWIWPAYL